MTRSSGAESHVAGRIVWLFGRWAVSGGLEQAESARPPPFVPWAGACACVCAWCGACGMARTLVVPSLVMGRSCSPGKHFPFSCPAILRQDTLPLFYWHAGSRPLKPPLPPFLPSRCICILRSAFCLSLSTPSGPRDFPSGFIEPRPRCLDIVGRGLVTFCFYNTQSFNQIANSFIHFSFSFFSTFSCGARVAGRSRPFRRSKRRRRSNIKRRKSTTLVVNC